MGYFTPEKFREKGLDHIKMIIEKDDEHSMYLMERLVIILDPLKETIFPETPDEQIVEI